MTGGTLLAGGAQAPLFLCAPSHAPQRAALNQQHPAQSIDEDYLAPD